MHAFNWVRFRGLEPQWHHHLLSWPPMGFTQNQGRNWDLYLWGRVEGRHSEARMANAGEGSGERGATHPHQLGVWGSAISSLTGVHGKSPAEIDIHCSVQWSVLKI